MEIKDNIAPQKTSANPPGKERVMGSWRRKITATELQVERDRNNLDSEDLKKAMHEGAINMVEQFHDDMVKHPALAATPQYYEWTP